MDDLDDDWDVEAELQRQLDELDTPTETENATNSFSERQVKSGSSLAETDASCDCDTALESHGNASDLQTTHQHHSKEVASGMQSLSERLEGLLKERESKLDEFHLTLEEILKGKARPTSETIEANEQLAAVVIPTPQGGLKAQGFGTKHPAIFAEPQSVHFLGANTLLAVNEAKERELLPPPPFVNKPDLEQNAFLPESLGFAQKYLPGRIGSLSQPASLGESSTGSGASFKSHGSKGPAGVPPSEALPALSKIHLEGSNRSPTKQEDSPQDLGVQNESGREVKLQQAKGKEGPQELGMERRDYIKDAHGDGVATPLRDLRSEILDLEYQVQLDSLQHHHELMTSAIDLARREELARQAEAASQEQTRRAAAEAAARIKDEGRRRRQEEREQRMQAIQSQLEHAAREAFAAKRIIRTYRAHRTRVRTLAAVRIQAAVRGRLTRRAYFQRCREHVIELLKSCEARNDVRGLEGARARARPLGLGDEADAAVRRTRSRVEEARAAMTSAADGGSRDEFERAREWAISAGVAPAEITAAEAVFAQRVSAKMADIESGIREGLPLVMLRTLMREAQALGVNKGRVDQLERDVVTRDSTAVQELQEAAQAGSYKGPGGLEEAVRKARGLGLLDNVEDAEEVMNLRRERVLEGLTRVIELQIGGQEDLTRLLGEAVRLDMGDAARAAENRWEGQVQKWVNELTQAARTGSRSGFVALVRGLRQRGRNDGVEAAKAVLAERLAVTRQGLAEAAGSGTKADIEKWVREARELDLVGDIREARRVQAGRVRAALECFKTAVWGGSDTSGERPGKDGPKAGLVSTAEQEALGLGVPETLLEKLRVAVQREESVKSCRKAGGFGGVFLRNGRGEPTERSDTANLESVQGRQHDVILAALALRSRGEHQFLANNPEKREGLGGFRRDEQGAETLSVAKGDSNTGALEGLEVLGAGTGVPVWPYRMDWDAIEQLRLHWQRFASSGPSKEEPDMNTPGGGFENGSAEAEENGGEGEGSSDEEGHVAAQEGLRSRKSQSALEASMSGRESGSALTQPGPVLTRALLEAATGVSGALTGVQTLDLALEGLRGLGSNGQFAKWCPNLISLRLDVNRLVTLEGSLAGLERTLETLSVRDNQLTSLRGLEGLSALQVLRLDANLIRRVSTGNRGEGSDVSKAADVSTSVWPALTELHLSANRIVSVQGLGEVCGNLEVLGLAGNGVRRLEGALRGLPRLRVLDVSRNRLRGRSLWSELRHCPLLTSLVASSNKITELPSPSALPGSVLLRELWLNGNGIRRLDALSWLPSLQRLYLQDNAIEGVGPLWGCPNLEVLDLSFNCISDPGDLRHLGCLRSLRSLQLNDNPVASSGHSYPSAVLSAVPWLRELDNEPVTESLRESVLRGLVTGRSGLLTCLLARTHPPGGVPRGERIILLSETSSEDVDTVSLQGDLDLIVDGGVETAAESDPLQRVKGLWERVLRAVELGESEGHFAVKDSAARANGIRHQRFCAEWRAALARSMRESTIAAASNAQELGRPESRFSAQSEINVSVGDRGAEEEAFFAPRGGKAPSPLLRQLYRCFQENVRFGTGNSTRSESTPGVQRNEGYYESEQTVRAAFVTKVQALWRGRQARIRSALLAEERKVRRQAAEKVAAVRIQALWRGFRVRRIEKRHVAREAAARTVQARWRGHFLRKKIERAMAAARYVDEDDFDYGGGVETLLTGFEGLSRPGTGLRASTSGAAVDPPLIVKKHGWVGPTDVISPRGAESVAVGERLRPLEGGSVQSGVRNPLLTKLEPLEGTDRNRNGTEGDENGIGSPCAAVAASPTLLHRKEKLNVQAGSQRLTTDVLSLTSLGAEAHERSPLQPIHTGQPPPSKRSVNGPPSGVVSLPAISPPRSSDSWGHAENSREARFSLPEIRLGSSQPEPTWRPSKRISEPTARSLSEFAGGDEDPDERTPRGEESSVRGSIQSTPRGPHVPRSQRKLEKQRQSISEIAQEWGFKDEGTAAAALRSRDRLLRNGQLERRRNTLQDPEKRLQLFKAHAKQGPRLGPRPALPKAKPAWAKMSETPEEEPSDG